MKTEKRYSSVSARVAYASNDILKLQEYIEQNHAVDQNIVIDFPIYNRIVLENINCKKLVFEKEVRDGAEINGIISDGIVFRDPYQQDNKVSGKFIFRAEHSLDVGFEKCIFRDFSLDIVGVGVGVGVARTPVCVQFINCQYQNSMARSVFSVENVSLSTKTISLPAFFSELIAKKTTFKIALSSLLATIDKISLEDSLFEKSFIVQSNRLNDVLISKCKFLEDFSVSNAREIKRVTIIATSFENLSIDNCWSEKSFSFSDSELFGNVKFSNNKFLLINFTKVISSTAQLEFENNEANVWMDESDFGVVQFIANLEKTHKFGFAIHRSRMRSLYIYSGVFWAKVFIESSEIDDLLAASTSFSNSFYILNSVLNIAPTFYGATFHDDTKFSGTQFLEITHQAETPYRTLKNLMSERENTIDEALFSSLELECNWLGLSWEDNFLEKLSGYFYRASNNFGRSISVPFLWIFTVWLISAEVYSSDTRINVVAKDSLKASVDEASVIAKGVLFSTVNTLGPLRFYSPLNLIEASTVPMLFISILQSLLCTYFWYLIIVWIRRRFRTN